MRKKILLIIFFCSIYILCRRGDFLAMQNDTEEIYYPWIEIECVRETCTEDGYVKYLNTDDGGTKIEILPSTGHEYKISLSEDAMMFEDGHLVEICEKCGDIFCATQDNNEEIYYPWIEIECVRETCTEDGYVKYLNTDDGETKIEVLSSTGHNYRIVLSEDATMFGDGHLVEVCEKCEDIQCYYVPYEGILFTDICWLLIFILLGVLFYVCFLWKKHTNSN